MNTYVVPVIAAGAMTLAALGFAGTAAAAPSGPSRVADTVATLEASGYHVIMNRTGAAPLSACTVTSVEPGRTYSTVDSRGGSSPSETILAKTVQVNLAC